METFKRNSNFLQGEASEKKSEFEEAIKFFESAKSDFLKQDVEKLMALRCIANITICKIRLISFEIIKKYKESKKKGYVESQEQASEYLAGMSKEFTEILEKYFQSDDEKLAFYEYTISIYRELEKFLLDQGFKDESTLMYISYKKFDSKTNPFISPVRILEIISI